MRKVKRTPAGDALTDLMLDLFRATSLILTSWRPPGRAPRADQRPLADPRRDRLRRTASTGLVACARPRRQSAERPADRQRPAQGRARRIRDEPASPAGAARCPDRQGKAGVRRRHGLAGALGERACGWPFGQGHRDRPPRRHSASDEARGLRPAKRTLDPAGIINPRVPGAPPSNICAPFSCSRGGEDRNLRERASEHF